MGQQHSVPCHREKAEAPFRSWTMNVLKKYAKWAINRLVMVTGRNVTDKMVEISIDFS